MRDSDYLWMPDTGSHKSIEIHTTQQMQPLGFDLRPRAERERDVRNARRRAAREETK